MEDEWTPPLMKTLDIDEAPLPVIWDADFLYSPRDPSGAETYVLCEINVSSCFAIRDEAPAAIARTIKGPHPSKFGIRPIRAAAPRAPGPGDAAREPQLAAPRYGSTERWASRPLSGQASMRCVTFEEGEGEAECQTGTNLVHRAPVRKRVPYGDVEAQIVANLPDQADQT